MRGSTRRREKEREREKETSACADCKLQTAILSAALTLTLSLSLSCWLAVTCSAALASLSFSAFFLSPLCGTNRPFSSWRRFPSMMIFFFPFFFFCFALLRFLYLVAVTCTWAACIDFFLGMMVFETFFFTMNLERLVDEKKKSMSEII